MAQKRFSDAVMEFDQYARSSYADGTARALRSSLTNALTEIGNIYVGNITAVHLDRWTSARAAAGIAPLTIRNNLTHFRMFADWARARKHAPMNWDAVGKRRTPKSVPSEFLRLPAHRFDELLDASRDAVDRVVIALGMYLFLRASEIKTLRVGHVNLQEGWVQVKVHKTGRKDRMPMSTELHEELVRWLDAYRKAMEVDILDEDWMLVPAAQRFGVEREENGRMKPNDPGVLRLVPDKSPTKIHWPIQRALTALGFDAAKEGCHTLRRSGARARFDFLRTQGYDGALREVQTMLHHQSGRTTEGYLGIDLDVVRRDEQIRGKRMYESMKHGLRAVK